LAEHFGPSRDAGGKDTPRGQINRNENKDRGRVVFMMLVPPDGEGEEEELAAVMFHIDEKHTAPAMFRAVALRTDSTARRDLSRAAATWLLGYLVEVTRQMRQLRHLPELRELNEVGADEERMGDMREVVALGFRPRPEPKPKINLSGRYLAFRAPVSTALPGTQAP